MQNIQRLEARRSIEDCSSFVTVLLRQRSQGSNVMHSIWAQREPSGKLNEAAECDFQAGVTQARDGGGRAVRKVMTTHEPRSKDLPWRHRRKDRTALIPSSKSERKIQQTHERCKWTYNTSTWDKTISSN